MNTRVLKPTNAMPRFPQTEVEPKQRGTGFMDRIFGNSRSQVPVCRTEPLTAPKDPIVKVSPPLEGNFWVESFFNALTEATTLFAKRHVELVAQEDPSTVYKVREVKIECKDAPAQFHRDVLSLPALVRNRVVKSRMQKAPGAEYLMLNDFFGSTIAADVTLLEGQVVQTMVSYSGSRFILKFAFEGDYVTRIDVPITPPQVVAPATPSTTPPSAAPELQSKLPDAFGDEIKLDPSYPRETVLRAFTTEPAMNSHRETQLRPKVAATVQPVANIRLRSIENELVLPLMEDEFPYTIGRHHSFKGYSVRGQHDHHASQVLHEAEGVGYSSFVSREHLVLHSFDASTKQFQVSTTKGKNGTFFRAATMPTHFLLPLSEMAKGEWLKLGGASGDGILELRIEAV